MSEAAVFTQTPAVQLPTGGDGSTVRAATGDVTDALGLQCLNQPGLITVPEGKIIPFISVITPLIRNNCLSHIQ